MKNILPILLLISCTANTDQASYMMKVEHDSKEKNTEPSTDLASSLSQIYRETQRMEKNDSYLVIGPLCSGKSTYINMLQKHEIRLINNSKSLGYTYICKENNPKIYSEANESPISKCTSHPIKGMFSKYVGKRTHLIETPANFEVEYDEKSILPSIAKYLVTQLIPIRGLIIIIPYQSFVVHRGEVLNRIFEEINNLIPNAVSYSDSIFYNITCVPLDKIEVLHNSFRSEIDLNFLTDRFVPASKFLRMMYMSDNLKVINPLDNETRDKIINQLTFNRNIIPIDQFQFHMTPLAKKYLGILYSNTIKRVMDPNIDNDPNDEVILKVLGILIFNRQ